MQIKGRSKNKQLAINMIASVTTFAVTLCVQFFLTPFIVKTLGAEAYGFIGLSSNILGYASLITIALNSMAGRFITIKYIRGEYFEANKYFASVFYSNLFLSLVISILSIVFVVWIEYFINIPPNLLFDVKMLFSLLSINTIVSLLFNTWNVSVFIKNRLDYSNIRSIIGNCINSILLLFLFSFFSPHIWFLGLTGFVMTSYVAITSYVFAQKLTPELTLLRKNYDWIKVLELLKSGVWNLISKLGEILGQGLDLLIANLFIGATAMGIFGLSRQIPFITVSFCAMISGVFGPTFTNLFARGEIGELKDELNKSIRIIGCIVTIPLVFLFVFGQDFYRLWLPTQDYHLIHFLSILCGLELVLSLPLEALWNIFTITNKVKASSLFMLGNHFLTFVIVIICLSSIESVTYKLVILASTRTILGLIRSLTFLPLYGAHCLNFSWRIFYSPMFKSLVAMAVTSLLCLGLKTYLRIDCWLILIISGILVALISCLVNGFIVLTSTDRKFVLAQFRKWI